MDEASGGAQVHVWENTYIMEPEHHEKFLPSKAPPRVRARSLFVGGGRILQRRGDALYVLVRYIMVYRVGEELRNVREMHTDRGARVRERLDRQRLAPPTPFFLWTKRLPAWLPSP